MTEHKKGSSGSEAKQPMMGPALASFKFLLYKLFLFHRVVVRTKGANLNKC